jgi:hypothetical protein
VHCLCKFFFIILPVKFMILIWFVSDYLQVLCMAHMRLLGLRYLSDLILHFNSWDYVDFTFDYSLSSLLLSVKNNISCFLISTFDMVFPNDGFHVPVSSFYTCLHCNANTEYINRLYIIWTKRRADIVRWPITISLNIDSIS